MCGIAGVLHTNPSEIDLGGLKRMTDIIAHRGPDGEGHWIDKTGHVGFGHRRLSIIDLSDDGHQPMHYANGRYTITFNGEIYNYIELRKKLQEKGCSFKSATDTEVLLALYERYKEQCLPMLDGMFSFAIWDAEEKILFFARDRFGEKPFHYAYEPGKYFIFGSEMKSLWANGLPKTPNNYMLYRYLTYGEMMNGEDLSETFYEGIVRLKAAHYGKLYFSTMKLELKRYWDIDYAKAPENLTEKEAVEKFRELFLTSTNRRLRADVPVGSSLSGGLDSSLIVCAIHLLNQKNNSNQHTFSARFPGFKRDEGAYMQKVIDYAKPTPHFVFPEQKNFLKQLEDVAYFQEEPFGSASICVQYDVMKLAKEKNITVLLDGQGADEVLAGYHYYYPSYFRQLKKENKQLFLAQLSQYHQLHEDNTVNKIHYRQEWKTRMADIIPFPLLQMIKSKRNSILRSRNSFVSKEFDASYHRADNKKWPRGESLNQSLYSSATGGDLQLLLRYADRNSMANSREVRLPFLSHELVEFIFTLPAIFKIYNGWTKYIMRTAFEDILPSEIAWRKDKIGYEPPQDSWMAEKEVKDQVIAFKESLVKEHILMPEVLDREFNDSKTIFDDKNWKVLMAGLLVKA